MTLILTLSTTAYGMQLPVMPLYLASLRVPVQEIGLTLGAFGLALTLFEFGWGWWSDRVGVGLPLIITRIGIAVALAAFAFAGTVPLFIAIEFAYGMFQCAIGPLPWSYFSHAIPANRRGQAIGLAQMANNFGTGIGAAAGGALVEWVGFRNVFLVAACIAALGGVLAFATFRTVGPTNPPRPPPTARRSYVTPLLVLSSVISLTWVGNQAERGFLPILAHDEGMHTVLIGGLMTVLVSGSAAIMVPLGWLSDRVGRAPVILSGLALGTCALASYSITSGSGLYAIASLRAAATAATQPVAIALLADVTPIHVRGRVMGLFGSLEDIGSALGPVIAGVSSATWGIRIAFLVMAGFYLVALGESALLIREGRWQRASATADGASMTERKASAVPR